jgi:hypothetical protein
MRTVASLAPAAIALFFVMSQSSSAATNGVKASAQNTPRVEKIQYYYRPYYRPYYGPYYYSGPNYYFQPYGYYGIYDPYRYYDDEDWQFYY